MIKLYGGPASRTFRVMWLLDELQLAHEHISFDHKKDPRQKSPELLALNPNGHVPTLVDGDIVLWESFAINLHLASNYGDGALMGTAPAERAAIYKWTLWGACELEGPCDAAGKLAMMVRGDWLRERYAVVEKALAAGPWLAAQRFTVADLHVASLLHRPSVNKDDVMSLPKVADWVKRIASRPAYQRVMAARAGVGR
jgi:glutathione S-transferase